MRLHLLFFFFFNFGLTRPFRPIQADTADTDRVGPILAASAPISAESAPTSAASARFGPCHVARCGPTRQGRAVCRVPTSRRVRRGCAGLGAASVHPRVWNLAIYTLEDFKMAASLDILPQDILKIGGRLLLKKFSKLMLMGQLLTMEKIPALE